MVSISTYGGWAGIAIIGAGYYWYLQSRRNIRRSKRTTTQKQVSKPADTQKEGRLKKQNGEGVQSGAESGTGALQRKKRKRDKLRSSKIDDSTPAEPTTTVDEGEGEDQIDNREFARQFQNAKAGIIGTSRPQAASRQRSVKQSQLKDNSAFNANGIDTSSNDFSSNAGVDGDDDVSVASSPHLGVTQARTSGDISDMLELPAAGPSVLKITEPARPSQPKKEPRQTNTPEMPESKKQRQRRQKNDERKAALVEEEKERRALMEKQRRTAREAEGRAAKDGSTFMAAKAPNSSAWTAAPATMNSGSTASKSVDLLDTYEPAADRVSKLSAPKPAASDDNKAKHDWDRALPSEEEQMRLIEEDTVWNTVPSRKAKKKGGDPEQRPTNNSTDNSTAKPTVKRTDKETVKSTDKSHDKSNVNTKQAHDGGESSSNFVDYYDSEPYNSGPVLSIGDPSINLADYSYKGGPANVVLDNGDGVNYGFRVEDDEWEVT